LEANKLSLAILEDFDPTAPSGQEERRFWCPICHGSHKRDAAHRCLSANINTGTWFCHRCKGQGLLIEFRPHKPTNYKPPTQLTPVAIETKPTPKSYDYQRIEAYLQPTIGSPAADYLANSRAIPLEALASFPNVRYMPKVNELPPHHKYISESVAFLLCDPDENPVGIQLRSIDGNAKPIYKATDAPHIFATPGALQAHNPIITEAPIDALTLAIAGYPAIATCGTNFPEALAQKFKGKKVILAQDADEAGDKAVTEITKILESNDVTKRGRLRPAGAKDWNEYAQKYGIKTLASHLTTLRNIQPQQPNRENAHKPTSDHPRHNEHASAPQPAAKPIVEETEYDPYTDTE
jgi:Toprim-like